MPDALNNPAPDQGVLEFFELERSPFVRLPAPTSIFHAEQYVHLMAHLAAATEETDSLVVLRGVDGSGKTTLLNRYLSCLDEDQSFVSIDDTCLGAQEFHSLFLNQIGFKNIDGKLEELQTIMHRFLVHRAAGGDTVLLVVDNAHLIHPAVFQELRWLAGIEHLGRRVVSVVLAGNAQLEQILASPAMSDLTFKNRADFHIRAFTEEETADFIRYRLMLEKADGSVRFTPEGLALIYRFTGGIPRSINNICNLLLAEACRQKTHCIDDDIVRVVAEAEQLPANVFPRKSRGRRESDRVIAAQADQDTAKEVRIQHRDPSSEQSRRSRVAATRTPDVDVKILFDKIAELSERIGQLKAEKSDFAATVETQSNDIRALREALASRETELDITNEGAQALKEELSAERRAVHSEKSKATRAQERIEALEKAKEKLQKASKELRADLQEAEKKVASFEKFEKQPEQTADEHEAALSKLEELEKLRTKIADKDATIAALKSELADLAASDTQTQVRLAELPADMIPDPSVDDGGRIVALSIKRQGHVEQVFKIPDGESRIMIGRSENSELRLESEFVSRHHALILCKADEIYIEDLHSFNGTIVNGKNITRRDLKAGDIIIIGEFRIQPIAKPD